MPELYSASGEADVRHVLSVLQGRLLRGVGHLGFLDSAQPGLVGLEHFLADQDEGPQVFNFDGQIRF